MPHREGEHAALFDMLSFAREVVSFVDGRHRHDLDTDRVLLRALERSFELIGECARRVSEGTRQAYPGVPWKGMVGMRNIIAHEYGQVNLDQIWQTAKVEVPRLVVMLDAIVARLPPPQ